MVLARHSFTVPMRAAQVVSASPPAACSLRPPTTASRESHVLHVQLFVVRYRSSEI
jgi:hypothetical protein